MGTKIYQYRENKMSRTATPLIGVCAHFRRLWVAHFKKELFYEDF